MKTRKSIDLSQISEEELLNCRLCDLPLTIQGSWLEECIHELYRELDEKGIIFKPACYLSDEWLTPDKEPVIGIPFFLADATLTKLEKKIMLEAEGSTKEWCMKLLRHETGHALNYAYKLFRKRKWKKIFGDFLSEYEDVYRFRPYSKNYVRHLDNHYAQCHPDEDFSETFAVWVTPENNWREMYREWKVLRKLEYIDELMRGLKNKRPLVEHGIKFWEVRKSRATLKNYYKKKKQYHAEEFPDFYDRELSRIFLPHDAGLHDAGKGVPAWRFLQKQRKNLVNTVARWTGEKKYIVDDLTRKLVMRVKVLQLKMPVDEACAIMHITAYVTKRVMNKLYTGTFSGDE